MFVGKCIEKLENRRDVRIVTSQAVLDKLVLKGNFMERHIINFPDFDFTIVELGKRIVIQNRPVLVGSQILSLAKMHMLKFYHDTLVPNLPPIEVILIDTDSIAFRCRTNDMYRELIPIKEHFDFSNLPSSHFLYSQENCKRFLYFKDECSGQRIKSFVTPRTKVYSILFDDNSHRNKLKGVQKAFVRNKILYEHYRACVLEKKTLMANFNSIISRGHNLYTVNVNKLALEGTDYKRAIPPGGDGIETLAYGNCRLNNA